MYEDLDAHLEQLGLSATDDGVPDDAWDDLTPNGGDLVPPVLRWFMGRFGGARAAEPIFYRDPKVDGDVMLGWLLDEAELHETLDDISGAVPDDLVPIANDGGDNLIVVDIGAERAGSVYFQLHDAPSGSDRYLLDGSLEHFLSGLHAGA